MFEKDMKKSLCAIILVNKPRSEIKIVLFETNSSENLISECYLAVTLQKCQYCLI